MDITRSACCRRLSFVNLASCPHCGKAFPPATLKAKGLAEDKAFNRKVRALFLAVFVVWAVVSIFILAQHVSKQPAANKLEHLPASLLISL